MAVESHFVTNLVLCILFEKEKGASLLPFHYALNLRKGRFNKFSKRFNLCHKHIIICAPNTQGAAPF